MDITSFIVAQRNKAVLVGDYGYYRRQLSRRLLVVRKKLNYVSLTSKGRKYAAKPPITVQNISDKPEFIHLLLLSSERAWAEAMQMKSLHAADSGTQGITGSTRRHIGSRLWRANFYAGQLVNLLQSRSESGATWEVVLEARAYHLSMRGSIEFEQQNWEKSLQEYSEAHFIYAALGRSGNVKHSDIFRELTASTIDPSIRYASYQLKLPRTTSIDKIVSRFLKRSDNEYVEAALKLYPETGAGKKSAENAQDLPQTITWRSRTVNLEDAAIAQALAAMSAAEEKLAAYLTSNSDLDTKAKASAYDDILIASQDAVDATKTAIDELTAEGVSPGDQRMQALQITRTSVNYALVGWRIGRNRVLCGPKDGAVLEKQTSRKPRKPRKDGKVRIAPAESNGRKLARLKERVVLFDATLQSLDSIKTLPGVAADDEFVKELESKRAYFASLKRVSPNPSDLFMDANGRRCLTIATSHALLGSTKQALALFARALSLASRLKPSVPLQESASSSMPHFSISPTQVSFLQSLLHKLVARHRAFAELESLQAISEADSRKSQSRGPPLVERLDEYPPHGADLVNLVTYPAQVQPVPVKPIFLDVAWNYIDYPGQKKNEAGISKVNGIGDEGGKVEEKKESKKGWFGFGR